MSFSVKIRRFFVCFAMHMWQLWLLCYKNISTSNCIIGDVQSGYLRLIPLIKTKQSHLLDKYDLNKAIVAITSTTHLCRSEID